MKNILLSLAAICSLTASESALIPRKELFKSSFCLGIKISPNGKQLAYVGQDERGAMNLFISAGHELENAKQLTHFKEPEIRGFHWSPDGKKILFLKDLDGTRQFDLFSIDMGTSESINLTSSFGPVNAKVFQVSQKENKAVVGINNQNPAYHDLYLLDMDTNSLTLFYSNNRFINFLFDDELKVAVKTELNPDSSLSLFDRNDKSLFTINSEDAFNSELLGYDESDTSLYLLDNRASNTTQLKKITLKGKETLLGHDEESDIRDVVFEKGKPLLYATYFTQKKWHPLNEKAKKHLEFITSKIGSNFEVISSSQEMWIIKEMIPDRGVSFWLYDSALLKLTLLRAASDTSLAQMHPFVIQTKDGKKLVCYLTLPKEWDNGGRPKKPLPLVVIPHGGPFKLRDLHNYSPDHQWLANRGYAVLSVNFRLSSGFGKDFVNAGNGEWGGKAHTDILEAVEWCIDQGIAQNDKIALYGGSYGGYEALAGLSFSPSVFACAVAICGPSNLKTVLKSCPFYWEFPASPLSERIIFYTRNAFFKSMGGDPNKETDCFFLEKCSPLNYVDQIQKPLLLIHGGNDPIVHADESEQIFRRMKEKNLPVLYLYYPDEGHGIRKSANAMVYLAYAEWMLAEVLGGKYEPLHEEDLKNSSVQIQSHGMHE